MSRSHSDLLAIKAELNTNPLGLPGYLPLANGANDEPNSEALNLVRDELKVDRFAVPISELAISRDEFNAISPADQNWILLVTQSGSINPKAGGEVEKGFGQIFSRDTVTNANLKEKFMESANRVEHLFRASKLERGGSVTPSDVSDARNVV